MDPLIAKLEKRFSPEFSRLLAKRLMNTPDYISCRTCLRIHGDKHPLNEQSTSVFVDMNSREHLAQRISKP